MSEFTDFLENKVLDHVFRNVAYTPATVVYLGLHTTVNSDATPGTEVTGSGYARKAVTFAAAAGGTIASSGIVSFTPSGGNYGTVVSTAIWDSLSGGSQLAFDNDFIDTAVNNGDTLEFAAGDIIVSLT